MLGANPLAGKRFTPRNEMLERILSGFARLFEFHTVSTVIYASAD